MQVRQVFSEYSPVEGPRPDYRYCPHCGHGLQAEPDGSRVVCPGCGYVRYRNPLPGVAVLVVEGGRVLLGKRGSRSFQAGKWGLPGGFIEHHEDFLTAGIRETREETGLEVEIRSILSVVSNFLSPELHTLVVVLLAQIRGGRLQAGDDLVELAWYSPSEPFPRMAFSADRHIIERFYSGGLWHAEGTPGAPVDPRFSALRG